MRRGVALLLLALPVPEQAELAAQTHHGRRPGEHHLVVDGVRLWYRVAGDTAPHASPVIYLHGGPGYDSHSFAHFMGRDLERSLTMVYLDQRGSGRSERPWHRAYSIEQLVSDVEQLREALGAPQVALIGHSFGAVIALEYAARHPWRTSRLALVDGFVDAPRSGRSLLGHLARRHPTLHARAVAERERTPVNQRPSDFALVLQALPGERLRAFLDDAQHPRIQSRDTLARVDASSGLRNTGELQAALIAQGLWSYRFEALHTITMPVLVVVGRHDHVIGEDAARTFADALPDARLLVYEHSGHFPYVDEPARLAVDLQRFLGVRTGRP